MTIFWVSLSIAGALFQAISSALNYRNLNQIKDVQYGKTTIGFFNYLAASLAMLAYMLLIGGLSIHIKDMGIFWKGIFISLPFNVLAVVISYRAMQLAEYSFIMPWGTLTTLFTVVTAYIGLREVPTPVSFLGIVLIVAGAVLISYKGKSQKILSEKEKTRRKNMRLATIYVILVGVCFSITPVGTKIAVQQSSPLLVGLFMQAILALTFFLIPILTHTSKKTYRFINVNGRKESSEIFPGSFVQNFKKIMLKKNFLMVALSTGIFISLANGSINTALQWGSVSYVMALKRLGPVFAFLIGYFFLKERKNVGRKLIATALMVVGAVLIGIFG